MTITANDLKPFCGGEDGRIALASPFSRGDYTYATNGHILIRVPRLSDVPDNESAPNPEALFLAAAPLPMMSFPALELPPQEMEECGGCCEGKPIHDCPHCICECEECDGKGEVEVKVSAELNGAIFNVKYLRLIRNLPGIQIPSSPPLLQAMPFSFSGGDVLLMPMNGPYKKHIGPIKPNLTTL